MLKSLWQRHGLTVDCPRVRGTDYKGLGRPKVIAIVNSAAMNTGVQTSVFIMVSSGYMPSHGVAGSYGNFIPSF